MFDAVADWTLLSLFGSEEHLISFVGVRLGTNLKNLLSLTPIISED